jgi:hypothetical protein
MLMVGSFDDKVKVWVIFHNSVRTRSSGKTTIYLDDAKMSIVFIGLCWLLGGLDRDNAQKISKNS